MRVIDPAISVVVWEAKRKVWLLLFVQTCHTVHLIENGAGNSRDGSTLFSGLENADYYCCSAASRYYESPACPAPAGISHHRIRAVSHSASTAVVAFLLSPCRHTILSLMAHLHASDAAS